MSIKHHLFEEDFNMLLTTDTAESAEEPSYGLDPLEILIRAEEAEARDMVSKREPGKPRFRRSKI